jgi:hypothetical protein
MCRLLASAAASRAHGSKTGHANVWSDNINTYGRGNNYVRVLLISWYIEYMCTCKQADDTRQQQINHFAKQC